MEKILFSEKKDIISERNSIIEIEPLIYKLKDTIEINNEKFFNILIAVTEAVNNAIVHGNKCDKNKMVHFSIKATKKSIEFIVIDEGNGFNPNSVPDPREGENLLKDSGRGIFLINALSDEYSYKITSSGTKVIMKFNINS